MWGSEVDQSERIEGRTELSTDTGPPIPATLQANLVKLFPCLMPSREREREEMREDRNDSNRERGWGRRQAKRERGNQCGYLRWGLMKVRGRREGDRGRL